MAQGFENGTSAGAQLTLSDIKKIQALMTESSLEPMFGIAAAAEMIPFPSVRALYIWLGRHKAEFPPRYRARGSFRGRHRMLLLSEVERIRAMTIRTGVCTRAGSALARIVRMAANG